MIIISKVGPFGDAASSEGLFLDVIASIDRTKRHETRRSQKTVCAVE